MPKRKDGWILEFKACLDILYDVVHSMAIASIEGTEWFHI